jgi:hypothetical protein
MQKRSLEDMRIENNEFNGIYRGVVEDNADPLLTGRVQVRIFGLHTELKEKKDTEGIPTDELPWAEPVMSLIGGSISGYGFWSVPLKGSHVMIFFENGNYVQPRYFATVPGIPATAPDTEKGFNDPDGVYPDKINESDFHRFARGVTDEGASPAFAAVYPHNTVLALHGGIIIEFDSTPDNIRIHVRHPSGTFVEINNDGKQTETIVDERDADITTDWNVTVGGNISITAAGNTTISTEGVTTIESTGNVVVTGAEINLN